MLLTPALKSDTLNTSQLPSPSARRRLRQGNLRRKHDTIYALFANLFFQRFYNITKGMMLAVNF